MADGQEMRCHDRGGEIGCLAGHDEAGKRLVNRQQDQYDTEIEVRRFVPDPEILFEGGRDDPLRELIVMLPELLRAVAQARIGLRTRYRYSPTASRSPRWTRSRSHGEKSAHGTQLAGAWVRDRQKKSGCPCPPAKLSRSEVGVVETESVITTRRSFQGAPRVGRWGRNFRQTGPGQGSDRLAGSEWRTGGAVPGGTSGR